MTTFPNTPDASDAAEVAVDSAGRADRVDWQAWQDSWDRQQEWYMPDREERFRVMVDMVEALVGDAPRVLDLACGTGSISDRVLRRLPGARCTGVDLDPALLAIGRGYFAGDDRVEFVTADLSDPAWVRRLPHASYDAVLTATALHWMPTTELCALYGSLADVLREGGVFLNADHMPEDSTPRINAAVRAHTQARQQRAREEHGALDWVDWWRHIAADPELAGVVAERFEIFGDPSQGHKRRGKEYPVRWHADTLRGAGFAEARQVWCSAADGLVLGLR